MPNYALFIFLFLFWRRALCRNEPSGRTIRGRARGEKNMARVLRRSNLPIYFFFSFFLFPRLENRRPLRISVTANEIRKNENATARGSNTGPTGAFFLHLARLARGSSQGESKPNHDERKTGKHRERERDKESVEKRVASAGLTSLFKCLDCQVAKLFFSVPMQFESIDR